MLSKHCRFARQMKYKKNYKKKTLKKNPRKNYNLNNCHPSKKTTLRTNSIHVCTINNINIYREIDVPNAMPI